MNRMRTNWITAILLTVLLPWLLFNTVMLLPEQVPATLPGPTIVPSVSVTESVSISVLTEDGTVTEMPLEVYLIGVVLGEMPESFDMEALKAQAVVARTYTLRMRNGSSKHPDADVCVRGECCQSYRDGDSPAIRAAVEATAGQVLTYEGKLIEATYFSSSGGRTEDALAVWGSDVPYLQSVESPEDEYAQNHLQTLSMTVDAFQTALGLEPTDPAAGWIGETTYTEGGGVAIMVIGGQEFKGTQLRKLLGLRSTAMVISVVGDHVIITTKGYGHRVGMSQYGAEAMAVDGATYEEILSHYYRGTSLELFVDKG